MVNVTSAEAVERWNVDPKVTEATQKSERSIGGRRGTKGRLGGLNLRDVDLITFNVAKKMNWKERLKMITDANKQKKKVLVAMQDIGKTDRVREDLEEDSEGYCFLAGRNSTCAFVVPEEIMDEFKDDWEKRDGPGFMILRLGATVLINFYVKPWELEETRVTMEQCKGKAAEIKQGLNEVHCYVMGDFNMAMGIMTEREEEAYHGSDNHRKYENV